MKYRTISVMVGKGSVNHNSRKFLAANVDPERTHLNTEYCNENIRTVYHNLFDEALERYNTKQTRADRKIADYYEKIRSGKQEKPFHELIIQIGNCDDTAADSEVGVEAKKILDEYFRGFQERNPNLRVFSAHLHMDEATPHLHIDFVPFITGSARGLDTRVSLKQALAAQGFKGTGKADTEWNRWVENEKLELEKVMERNDFGRIHKHTHEEHLDVLDYKKKVRTQEVAELDAEVAAKSEKVDLLEKKIENLTRAEEEITTISRELDSPEYQIPEPERLMSAKSYKAKIVDPFIAKLKQLAKTIIKKYFEAKTELESYRKSYGRLVTKNDQLKDEIAWQKYQNQELEGQVKDYKLLRKVLGSGTVNKILREAKANKQAVRHRRKTELIR